MAERVNREKELLAMALIALEDAHLHIDKFQDEDTRLSVMEQIKELLAQPEQQPDLWVVTNPWGVMELMWSEPREQVYANYKVTKFYRSPLKSKPLSVEESLQAAIKLYEAEDGLDYPEGFVDGLKYAEKMHGIGVYDETV